MIQKNFVAAMNDTFGRKPGQTLMEFKDELQKLTPEDRAWFKERFAIERGIEIVATA